MVSSESFGCRSTGLLGLARRFGLGGRDRSGSDDGGRDPCVREFRGFYFCSCCLWLWFEGADGGLRVGKEDFMYRQELLR